MTWARLDDLYDDHPKLLAAVHVNPLAAAVHAQAITATARRQTDGLVDPFWLLARIPDLEERTQTLSVLRELGLFDLLPAGETRELVDGEGYAVTLGPFTEDRYLVHDYLDYNASSVQIRERRFRDAQRKRLSARTPVGAPLESEGSPGAPAGAPAQARGRAPIPSHPIERQPLPRGRAARPGARGRQNTSTEGARGRPPTDTPVSPQQLDAQATQLQRQRELCSHFPGVPPAIVLNTARRLSKAGEVATLDAIRAELEA